ncbi:Gfo/Idh/MocA family oxidoreductase [uncultured Dokdonia sp.]|uniref:Gfo/Idh/MocA family protein n=1 Tax=uncultured Dokdonia sp. TaxID=575653 RepID=UPI002627DE2F|nr:Gfo/Idh/MocA family oxidoreductase [uncultured Dokdonia sp.]
MKTINHAIVGCGRIAPNHVDGLTRIENVKISYAIDKDIEVAKAFAERFDIPNYTDDYAKALEDDTLHSVSLNVPHDLHGSMAQQAVEANKHVLLEKPFVIKLEEGEQLVETARERGLIVMPIVQHHYDVLLIKIKEMIDSGAMGTISMLRGHLECNRPPSYYSESEWRGSLRREGGSVLINQAYHVLDLMIWLCGSVDNVMAHQHTTNTEVMETEDVFTASLRFKNRALASLSVCGAGGSSWRNMIEIISDKGVISFDISHPNQLFRFELKSKKEMKLWRKQFSEILDAPQSSSAGTDYYGISHRPQIKAFIEAIQGSIDIKDDQQHALNIVNTIDALYTSSRQQTYVDVQEILINTNSYATT